MVKKVENQAAIEVQFPDYSDILAGSGVQTRMNQAWQDTLNATTIDHRREEGYFITLDTSGKGTWSIANHTIQHPPATNVFYIDANGQSQTKNRARFSFINIAGDIPINPSPVESGVTYVVGWFHTHTPTVYSRYTNPTSVAYRIVGPSGTPNQTGGDYGFSYKYQLPGFVYDYVSVRRDGGIPFGHPLNSSAQIYDIVPVYRRPTP